MLYEKRGICYIITESTTFESKQRIFSMELQNSKWMSFGQQIIYTQYCVWSKTL